MSVGQLVGELQTRESSRKARARAGDIPEAHKKYFKPTGKLATAEKEARTRINALKKAHKGSRLTMN